MPFPAAVSAGTSCDLGSAAAQPPPPPRRPAADGWPAPILILECGNSNFGEDIIRDGWVGPILQTVVSRRPSKSRRTGETRGSGPGTCRCSGQRDRPVRFRDRDRDRSRGGGQGPDQRDGWVGPILQTDVSRRPSKSRRTGETRGSGLGTCRCSG
jgi:hypothetical protein